MGLNGHQDPYNFDLKFEQALVAMLCGRPKFYGIIGHAVHADLLTDPSAKLLAEVAQSISQELGHGPDSSFLVIQRLRRLMFHHGKISWEELQTASNYLDAAEDAGLPPDESMINELKPILNRRIQKDVARLALEEYSSQGDFTKVSELIHESQTLGVINRNAGMTFGADALDTIANIRTMERLPTGIVGLDNIIGGLQRGGLGLVIAPTGGGKSFFLIHMAAYNMKRGIDVIYITLELPEFIILSRIASNLTGVPVKDIQEGGMLQAAKNKLATMALGECRIKDFPPRITTVADIREWIKDQQSNKKYSLIIIDYGDKLGAPNAKKEYDTGLIVFEALRYLAVENNCYLWTASQSQRSTRESLKRLDLHHVADSSHKPRESDLVITLTSSQEGKMMEYLVAKNRTGVGRVTVGPWPTEFEIGRMCPLPTQEETDWNAV